MNVDCLDYKIIADEISPKAKVLDLGCGDGKLLSFLVEKKGVRGQGIELSQEYIHACVEKGLSVFNGDIETGLPEYPDKVFDYVILNQSMQEVKNVDYVIEEALRVGKKIIIGFPNFAYIRCRLRLLLKGKSPMTKALPYRWYNTPNLHFLSILDFKNFCIDKKINIIAEHYLNGDKIVRFMPNVFAVNAIFVIS